MGIINNIIYYRKYIYGYIFENVIYSRMCIS